MYCANHDSQSGVTIPSRSSDAFDRILEEEDEHEVIVKVREVKQGSFSMISNASVHKH